MPPPRKTPPLRAPWLLALSAGFLVLVGAGPTLSGPKAEEKPSEATELKAAPIPKKPPPDRGFGPVFVNERPLLGCDKPTGALERMRGSGMRVALTFDDGPSDFTGQVLDILKREKAKGTFFVVGKEFAGRRALLRRTLAEGHMLANHSYTHANLSSGDPAAMKEVRTTNDSIKALTGFTPCLFRAPYGAASPKLLTKVAKEGQVTVKWDVDTNDYMGPGTPAIVQTATTARAGSIVLMHDGGGNRSQTVAALPSIIKDLRAKGYDLVTVDELLDLDREYGKTLRDRAKAIKGSARAT